MPRFAALLLVVFLSSFGLLSSFGPALAQVYYKVQGTNLWLAPPKNYETSHSFTGFENKKTDGSILIMSLPRNNAAKAYEEFQQPDAFTKTMKSQGFDIDGYQEGITRDGIDFKIYHGTQNNNGIVYYRWISMFFLQNVAYVVTIQTPDKTEFDDENIMKLYQQIRFMGELSATESIDTLPFIITPASPFIIDTVLMGNTVQLSLPNIENSPRIMVSMDMGYALPNNASDAQKFYLASIASGFKVKPDAKSQTVEFANTKGLLIEGTATTDTGDVNFMLYTSVDENGRIFYLHATGKKDQLEKYQTQINEIAKSVIPRSFETGATGETGKE